MPDHTIRSDETPEAAALREQIRAHYAAAALAVAPPRTLPLLDTAATTAPADTGHAADCCGDATGDCCDAGADAVFGALAYDAADRERLPDAAVLASLGCGNPTAVADLRPGETVLDLGSGGGIDVLLSGRRVGPSGKVYGLDMTDEMLALARANAAAAGATNVEFLKGRIEQVPLPDASVDVIISNCVINLSTDKPAVFAEAYRVLRSGGRLGVSDVVAEDGLSLADRAERGGWVGCVAGALSRGEYEHALAAAGFTGIEVTFTNEAADGIHPAIVKATKPAGVNAG